ncbi:KTSC domain-containing protein [Herbaspirillum seropedicae]|uniref:KTSC domain-containing protein n=1 Tax=Herbaspirillum seropedicae TaxID=964 RepID=UPI003F8D7CAB
MNRDPVTSSNVTSVGYDPDSGTLEVEFHNGSIYQYFDVPEALYNGLIHADSVGGFLAAHVKGTYRFSRV